MKNIFSEFIVTIRGGQKIQFNEIAPILSCFIPFKIHLFKSVFFSNPYFINISNQKSIFIKRILKIGKSKFPIRIFFLSLSLIPFLLFHSPFCCNPNHRRHRRHLFNGASSVHPITVGIFFSSIHRCRVQSPPP